LNGDVNAANNIMRYALLKKRPEGLIGYNFVG